jgi:hypothetical protein
MADLGGFDHEHWQAGLGFGTCVPGQQLGA